MLTRWRACLQGNSRQKGTQGEPSNSNRSCEPVRRPPDSAGSSAPGAPCECWHIARERLWHLHDAVAHNPQRVGLRCGVGSAGRSEQREQARTVASRGQCVLRNVTPIDTRHNSSSESAKTSNWLTPSTEPTWHGPSVSTRMISRPAVSTVRPTISAATKPCCG
jgi:hypothetical protein